MEGDELPAPASDRY